MTHDHKQGANKYKDYKLSVIYKFSFITNKNMSITTDVSSNISLATIEFGNSNLYLLRKNNSVVISDLKRERVIEVIDDDNFSIQDSCISVNCLGNIVVSYLVFIPSNSSNQRRLTHILHLDHLFKILYQTSINISRNSIFLDNHNKIYMTGLMLDLQIFFNSTNVINNQEGKNIFFSLGKFNPSNNQDEFDKIVVPEISIPEQVSIDDLVNLDQNFICDPLLSQDLNYIFFSFRIRGNWIIDEQKYCLADESILVLDQDFKLIIQKKLGNLSGNTLINFLIRDAVVYFSLLSTSGEIHVFAPDIISKTSCLIFKIQTNLAENLSQILIDKDTLLVFGYYNSSLTVNKQVYFNNNNKLSQFIIIYDLTNDKDDKHIVQLVENISSELSLIRTKQLIILDSLNCQIKSLVNSSNEGEIKKSIRSCNKLIESEKIIIDQETIFV